VQQTLQNQFLDKQNDPLFEPRVDNDSILRMSKRQIFEESENPCELPYYSKSSYPQKLKREDLTTFTGSCKAIFQGQLPPKKKDLGSFNSIGKVSIKEARYSIGEGINLIPTWLIEKLKRIQIQPSTVTLTVADGSLKNSDGKKIHFF